MLVLFLFLPGFSLWSLPHSLVIVLAAQQRGVETSTGTKPAPIAPSSSSPLSPDPISLCTCWRWAEVMEGVRRSQPRPPGAAGAVAQGTAPVWAHTGLCFGHHPGHRQCTDTRDDGWNPEVREPPGVLRGLPASPGFICLECVAG